MFNACFMLIESWESRVKACKGRVTGNNNLFLGLRKQQLTKVRSHQLLESGHHSFSDL